MRSGQNKRMRGRNNNGGNRKGPNPLTRSYESNGPDVKIRGTAQHIGEKYLQLARDAQTSGDPVSAESYLQHAEHYFRLIAAAHQALQQAQPGYTRQPGEAEQDEAEDDDDVILNDRFASPAERPAFAPPPQPYAERQSFNPDRQNGGERYERQDRAEGQQDRPYRQERPERYGNDRDNRQDRNGADRQAYDRQGQDRQGQDRQGQDRQGQERQLYDRGPRPERADRGDRNDRGNRPPRFPREDQRGDREPREYRDMQYREQPRVANPVREPPPEAPRMPQPQMEAEPELPAFIKAPVRAVVAPPPSIEPDMPAAELAQMVSPSADGTDTAPAETFAVRPRRRRRPRIAGGEGEAPVDAAQEASSE